MCGDIIFLIELLKKNKFKNLLIIVQIVISVFYLTFFLIPITEAIDTDILMKKLNMKNDIAFFDEAQHISFLPENYNNDRYEEKQVYSAFVTFLFAARFPGCTTGGGHPQGCIESAPGQSIGGGAPWKLEYCPRKLPGGYR